MLVYKLLRAAEWAGLDAAGASRGSPAGLADGYVHLSTAAQLAGTLAKHYAGESGLVLAALDAEAAGPELRWEPARGGGLFPHLYRPLRRAELVWARPLDGHALPDGLA
jgi:uncharacterized protein (DUF952 family)